MATTAASASGESSDAILWLTCAATSGGMMRPLLVSMLVGLVLAGCSSSPSPAATRGATDAAVISAWKAAENAIYDAEASPSGISDPQLPATMVGSELQLVRQNLAGDETDGLIGSGHWDLGSPKVESLEPVGVHATTATVVSCVHDTAILINEHTGQPAKGVLGTPDWAGETSTMVLTSTGWKLSHQSGVLNVNRSTACAGL